MLVVYLLPQAGSRSWFRSLQGGRLRPRTARSDHQIAAVLNVERDEAGVLRRGGEGPETPVHGQALAPVRAEVDIEPVEERPVVGDVVFPDPLEGLSLEAVEILPGPPGRVPADVAIIHEVRGRDEMDRGLPRVRHRERAARRIEPAVRLDLEQGDFAERAVLHGDGQSLQIPVRGQTFRLMRRIQADAEGQLLRPVGGQAHDDDLVGVAGEHLPGEGRAVHHVGDPAQSPADVEVPLVIGEPLVPGKVDGQVPEGLIRHLAQRNAHEAVHGQRFRLPGLAGEQELPDPPEVFRCARMGVVVRPARPERLFVELDALAGHSAEDHGAEAPVAHGQGFVPGPGRPV